MSVKEKSELFEAVESALNQVRPHLMVDGGNVELVDVTSEMVVHIRWIGNCETCSMSAMTLKAGIEQAIKQYVPQVKAVQAINGFIG